MRAISTASTAPGRPGCRTAGGDATIIVAAAGLFADDDQLALGALLGDVTVILHGDVPCRGRERSERSDWHGAGRLGQHDLVALLQGDDGLLPGRASAGLVGPLAARLAPHVHGAQAGDLHLEELLDGPLDLGFGRRGGRPPPCTGCSWSA